MKSNFSLLLSLLCAFKSVGHVQAKKGLFTLVARDIYKLAPGQLAQILCGFGFSILLGKYMQPEALGVYTLFFIAQSYIVSLSSGWLTSAAVRFLPEKPNLLNTLLHICVVQSLLLGILGIATVTLLTKYIPDLINAKYAYCTAFIVSLSMMFSVFQCLLRGMFEQKWFSWCAVLLATTKIVFLVTLLPKSEDPVLTALIVYGISHVPVLIFQIIKLMLMEKQPTKNIQCIHIFKRALKYGMPLTISLFLISFLQSGDRYILVEHLNIKDIGIYAFWAGIGVQLTHALYSFVSMALNPRLFQLYNSNQSHAISYVKRLSGVYLLIGGPILVMISLLVQYGMGWIGVKNEYINGSYLLNYGIVAAFLTGLTNMAGMIRHFQERTGIFVFASCISILVMASGVFVIVPLLGLPGAGIGTSIGFITYYAIVSFSCKNWPPIFDLLVCFGASGFLLVLNFFAVNKVGMHLTVLLLLCALVIHFIFAFYRIRKVGLILHSHA